MIYLNILFLCRQKLDIKENGAFSISIQRFSLCNFDDSAKEKALCFKMIYLYKNEKTHKRDVLL